MQEEEHKAGALIALLRNANSFEIGLVALLILPATLLAWVPILKEILPGRSYELARPYVFAVLVGAYVTLVVVMLRGKREAERLKAEKARKRAQAADEKRRLESARSAICFSLAARGLRRASFDKIRRDLNRDLYSEEPWDDAFLSQVVEAYPLELCPVAIKGGLRGLRLLCVQGDIGDGPEKDHEEDPDGGSEEGSEEN